MVTFDFYRDFHFGTLKEIDFNRQLPWAIKQFNNATFNRVTAEMADNDDFKRCVCHLVDLNHRLKETGGAVSMSDGVTSISYNANDTPENQRNKILTDWLGGYFDLTFRGF